MCTRVRAIEDRGTAVGWALAAPPFCVLQADRPGIRVVGGKRKTQELFDSPQRCGPEEDRC